MREMNETRARLLREVQLLEDLQEKYNYGGET